MTYLEEVDEEGDGMIKLHLLVVEGGGEEGGGGQWTTAEDGVHGPQGQTQAHAVILCGESFIIIIN